MNKDCLYKYMPFDSLLKVLSNYTLRCTCPILFNDPFDSNLENIFHSFENEMNLFCNIVSQGKFNQLSKQDQEKIYIETMTLALEDMKMKDEYINTVRCLYTSAIFCLSAVYDNILMWSHYANYHKGAVIEINLEESRKKGTWLSRAQPVNYSDCHANDYLQLIYTKASIWAYEKEWRVNIAYEFTDEIPLEKRVTLLKFNPLEISSIIFGIQTPIYEIQNIINIIRSRSELSHIKLYKMKRHPGKFLIERTLL